MKKKYPLYYLIIITFLLVFPGTGYSQRETFAPVIACEEVDYFPHDMNAFTQGFLYHNGVFYESTGKHGRSSVRKIEMESGEILRESRIGQTLFGEGLCLWKNRLYQLTWRSGKCFVYDSRSLARKRLFKYKGQGWGLTTDGQFIFQSNGSSEIILRDPYDFKRISKVSVKDGPRKVHRINELEYINGLIYCNIWQEDLIAAVNPIDGMVKFWIDISSLRPEAGPEAEAANGIAWDRHGKRLFVTGKFWSKVFHIKLPDITSKIAARKKNE